MIYIDRNQPRSLSKAVSMLSVDRAAARPIALGMLTRRGITQETVPHFAAQAVQAAYEERNPSVLSAYALPAAQDLGQRPVLKMFDEAIASQTGGKGVFNYIQHRKGARNILLEKADQQANEAKLPESERQNLYTQVDRMFMLRRQITLLRAAAFLEDSFASLLNLATHIGRWLETTFVTFRKTQREIDSSEPPVVNINSAAPGTIIRIPDSFDGFEITHIIPADRSPRTKVGRLLNNLADRAHHDAGFASPYGTFVAGLLERAPLGDRLSFEDAVTQKQSASRRKIVA